MESLLEPRSQRQTSLVSHVPTELSGWLATELRFPNLTKVALCHCADLCRAQPQGLAASPFPVALSATGADPRCRTAPQSGLSHQQPWSKRASQESQRVACKPCLLWLPGEEGAGAQAWAPGSSSGVAESDVSQLEFILPSREVERSGVLHERSPGSEVARQFGRICKHWAVRAGWKLELPASGPLPPCQTTSLCPRGEKGEVRKK